MPNKPANRESTRRLEERLKSEGRWDAFQTRWTELKKTMSGSAAWNAAKLEFGEAPRETPALVAAEAFKAQPVQADEFSSRQGSSVGAIRWVANNLQVADVKPANAPSADAWGLLCWARSSGLNESEFWRGLYPKVLPSKTELNDAERFSDDDSNVLSCIARIETWARESAAEVDARELERARGNHHKLLELLKECEAAHPALKLR